MSEEKIRSWARFLSNTRKFFDSNNFCEVVTPCLVPAGAFEAGLDSLLVRFSHGEAQLHTSPEIAMKCLMAESPMPIYQICRSFRDDPPSPIHFREFTMLEFYRPNVDYRDVLNITIELIESISGRKLDWLTFTVNEAWKEFVEFDLASCSDRDRFAHQVSERGLAFVSENDTWEDIFFKVMTSQIEPKFPAERPVILTDYPIRLCTLLAKSDDSVDRFEIYWRGMEICNGGTELVDGMALRERYKIESSAREDCGKAPHPFPQNLFDSMATMPPMAGVAIGMERLKMALDYQDRS